jgi:hypothetical protein
VAFLERNHGAAPAIVALAPSEALERLLLDRPSYGAEVDARDERTISRLVDQGAYRLRYESLEDGMRLVARLADGEI